MKSIRYFTGGGHQSARHLKRNNLSSLQKGIEKQLYELRVVPVLRVDQDLKESKALSAWIVKRPGI